MRVGVTGGIGSGKSTVCRLFSLLGVPVYDSDSQARRLMNENEELVGRIKVLLGESAYNSVGLDRGYVGSRVFSDPALLSRLNAVVHPVVGADFKRWCDLRSDAKYVILESAILFESGFNKYVDLTVVIVAPESERIVRTASRDGINEQSVRARMVNQMSDRERERLADYTIHNDENTMITDQILGLNEIFVAMSV